MAWQAAAATGTILICRAGIPACRMASRERLPYTTIPSTGRETTIFFASPAEQLS